MNDIAKGGADAAPRKRPNDDLFGKLCGLHTAMNRATRQPLELHGCIFKATSRFTFLLVMSIPVDVELKALSAAYAPSHRPNVFRRRVSTHVVCVRGGGSRYRGTLHGKTMVSGGLPFTEAGGGRSRGCGSGALFAIGCHSQ